MSWSSKPNNGFNFSYSSPNILRELWQNDWYSIRDSDRKTIYVKNCSLHVSIFTSVLSKSLMILQPICPWVWSITLSYWTIYFKDGDIAQLVVSWTLVCLAPGIKPSCLGGSCLCKHSSHHIFTLVHNSCHVCPVCLVVYTILLVSSSIVWTTL